MYVDVNPTVSARAGFTPRAVNDSPVARNDSTPPSPPPSSPRIAVIVAVVPAVETSPGVAQAQPRLEVHEAHVEVHALAHQGAALLCEEEEFGSAPDASSSVEDDDE